MDIDGGAGNDWIKASLELKSDDSNDPFSSFPGDPGEGTTVDGGAGDDTIIGGFIVNGGSGNDTLDMRGWVAKSPFSQWGIGKATVVLTGEFGHDRILSDHDAVDEKRASFGPANSTGLAQVLFKEFLKDNFSFIFDVKSYKSGGESGLNALGNLAIANNSTGDSLLVGDLKMLLGQYDDGHYELFERSWDPMTQNSLGAFVFDDGIAAIEVVQFGSTAQYEAFWGV